MSPHLMQIKQNTFSFVLVFSDNLDDQLLLSFQTYLFPSHIQLRYNLWVILCPD